MKIAGSGREDNAGSRTAGTSSARERDRQREINLATFDLNLLRVFEAVARDRSVSIAASRLGLTQSAVSNALGRLRHILDDALFVRTRHGMEPTAVAARLIDPLRDSLTDIRSLLAQSLPFDPLMTVRTFTMIMIDVGEIILLPRILSRLAVGAPSIRLRLLDIPRHDYETYLDGEQADFVVGGVKLSPALRSALLFSARHVAVMDGSHPALQRATDGSLSIDQRAYEQGRHVALSTRGATTNRLEARLEFEAMQRDVYLSIPHAGVLSSVIPGTDLIATLPVTAAAAIVRSTGLVAVPLPFPVDLQPVHLWWHRRHDQDAAHRWMRELMIDDAREIGRPA